MNFVKITQYLFILSLILFTAAQLIFTFQFTKTTDPHNYFAFAPAGQQTLMLFLFSFSFSMIVLGGLTFVINSFLRIKALAKPQLILLNLFSAALLRIIILLTQQGT